MAGVIQTGWRRFDIHIMRRVSSRRKCKRQTPCDGKPAATWASSHTRFWDSQLFEFDQRAKYSSTWSTRARSCPCQTLDIMSGPWWFCVSVFGRATCQASQIQTHDTGKEYSLPARPPISRACSLPFVIPHSQYHTWDGMGGPRSRKCLWM